MKESENNQERAAAKESALSLFRAAQTDQSKEDQKLAALKFCQQIARIVDQPLMPKYPVEDLWDQRTVRFDLASEIVKGKQHLPVSSGTRGCRIKIIKEKDGWYMEYPKPTGDDWTHGAETWKNFMKVFNAERVKLTE